MTGQARAELKKLVDQRQRERLEQEYAEATERPCAECGQLVHKPFKPNSRQFALMKYCSLRCKKRADWQRASSERRARAQARKRERRRLLGRAVTG